VICCRLDVRFACIWGQVESQVENIRCTRLALTPLLILSQDLQGFSSHRRYPNVFCDQTKLARKQKSFLCLARKVFTARKRTHQLLGSKTRLLRQVLQRPDYRGCERSRSCTPCHLFSLASCDILELPPRRTRHHFRVKKHTCMAAVKNDEHIHFGFAEHDLYLSPVDLFIQTTAFWWGTFQLATR
jgi:hypothetical protein